MAYNTAVRGLSAQGPDELKGMCYSNNDVAFTMTSTEFANSGFKYVVIINDSNTSESYKFYISPNAVGSGVFNAKTIFNQLVSTSLVIPNSDDILIQISEPLVNNQMMVNTFVISLFEGYDVAGVFTEDESVKVEYNLMCVYGKGKSNFLVMGSNETLPIALSECFDNTIGFNAETIASRINIPLSLQQEVINWQRISRSNVTGDEDSAYKILSFVVDDASYINSNYLNTQFQKIYFDLYDNEYNVIQSFNIDINLLLTAGGLLHIPVGLKNLVNGGYITQDDADNTSFWTVFLNDINTGNPATAKYGFYIDEDCKHNPVHVYWLNQKGGWDSYSFIKKNERSIEVEKKRYKQYLGDYNNATSDAPFETRNYSRSLTEREPIVKTFINLTSDWVTESEFKFMKDLFQSKSVWMVDDNVDGYTILPVVVEDNNFLMRRERNSRKYNQSLRLQLANEYDTLNITASEYPIPGPDPCVFFDTFTKNGGSSTINIGTNFGDACNLVLTSATQGRYITVDVSNGTDSPVAGQTYYVQIDYTNNTPRPVIKSSQLGWIKLGNTLAGGATTYFDLQNAGTPIIATGVWGTTATPPNNYFSLKIPNFGTGTVTGNIYVTIGFGNCP
jgi:hypothetical protein